jgi:hypothetical protein
MVFHCAQTQAELCGDFVLAVTGGDELERRLFTRR